MPIETEIVVCSKCFLDFEAIHKVASMYSDMINLIFTYDYSQAFNYLSDAVILDMSFVNNEEDYRVIELESEVQDVINLVDADSSYGRKSRLYKLRRNKSGYKILYKPLIESEIIETLDSIINRKMQMLSEIV